jgi:hypothetical protein
MNQACTGQPVSWLELERLHLGELGPEARARIQTHLESCPACRDCLTTIQVEAEPALPALVLPARPEARPWFSWRWLAPGLAAAALLVWALWPIGSPTTDGLPAGLPPGRVGVKGAELGLDLVRERAGQILEAPSSFAPGDRFKALLTCPAPATGGPGPRVTLVAYQSGQAFFPLGETSGAPLPRCGNRVPLAGAFLLTGADPVAVCALVTDRPLPRSELERGLPAWLSDQATCRILWPEPHAPGAE